MTFKEFRSNMYSDVWRNKPSYIRDGQALFNYLCVKWPEEGNRLTGDSKLDCFANDAKITNLMNHLEENWENYPN